MTVVLFIMIFIVVIMRQCHVSLTFVVFSNQQQQVALAPMSSGSGLKAEAIFSEIEKKIKEVCDLYNN